jgi:uncharacterized protein (TIGR02996 family)
MQPNLLAAVLAAPDDDQPRLVLADWLMERGDPRGELIQVACTLASLARNERQNDAPSRKALETRERSLLSKHGRDWLAPFRRYIRSWSWARGFVEFVAADAAEFTDGVETILAHTPLERLELTGMKANHPALLAGLDVLSRLRSFAVNSQRLNGKRGGVLLSAPVWSGLRALEISFNPLGDECVTEVAENTALRGLCRLKAEDIQMTAEGFAALSRAPFFSRLEHLNLAGNWLGPSAGAMLARCESLVQLDLRGCAIGDAGIAAIAASPGMARLKGIVLFGNGIGVEGMNALIGSPHLGELRDVRVMGGSGVPSLSETGNRLRERFAKVL